MNKAKYKFAYKLVRALYNRAWTDFENVHGNMEWLNQDLERIENSFQGFGKHLLAAYVFNKSREWNLKKGFQSRLELAKYFDNKMIERNLKDLFA